MTDTAQLPHLPIKPSILASLPHVMGVELLASGNALLHLQGGAVVDVPAQHNASINPDYAPLVLRLETGGCFILPAPLLLPIMWALGFTLPDGGEPLLLAGVEPLEGQRARLSLGGGHTVTLPRLPRLSLSGIYPDGEALLFTDWRSSAAPAFRVPAALYAQLVAALGLQLAPHSRTPRWVLSDVALTAEAVTFWAAPAGAEAAPVLTLARPCWAQLGHNLDTGLYLLTVAQDEPPALADTLPTFWRFSVDPSRPQVWAALEALGLAGSRKRQP